MALTLRNVSGLTTPEIASAFLLPESTMAQRIVRAKKKISGAGVPYRVPPLKLLPERLAGVLAVLYLLAPELLQHSPRAACLVDGELVPLDEQDRLLWDSAAIDGGLALLRRD